MYEVGIFDTGEQSYFDAQQCSDPLQADEFAAQMLSEHMAEGDQMIAVPHADNEIGRYAIKTTEGLNVGIEAHVRAVPIDEHLLNLRSVA